jgi:putative oxidoreductase
MAFLTFYISKLNFMARYHLISRIAVYLLSVVLITFGIFHFTHPRDLMNYVPPDLPGGIKWVYVVGGALILVGVSFLFNQFVKLSGYLLFILLIVFVLFIHLPNYKNASNTEDELRALINIFKDVAIAAFALHIAAGAHHQHLHFEEND